MRVLALDISRKRAGWAIDSASVCPPLAGSRSFGEPGNPFGRISLIYKNWLVDMIKVNRPEMIMVEAPIIAGVPIGRAEAKILLGLPAVTELVCEIAGVRYHEAAVSTVRKYFLGTARPGDNPKRFVADKCRQLGWTMANDDQSDAAALWSYAKATFDRSFRLETGPLLSLVDAARRVA